MSTFDLPSTEAGKKVITRDNLPEMDASVSFEPIDVEVTGAKSSEIVIPIPR